MIMACPTEPLGSWTDLGKLDGGPVTTNPAINRLTNFGPATSGDTLTHKHE
jgi:hypothetical protein